MATNRRGHVNIGLMIVVAIIGIIAAIVIPALMNIRPRRDGACLTNLVLASLGRAPADAACPVAGKPYVVAEADGRRTVACPDPENHLGTRPRALAAGGVARLEHDLPAFDARPDSPVDLGSTTLTDRSDRVEIEEHRGVGHYVFLVFLGCIAAAILRAWTLVTWGEIRRDGQFRFRNRWWVTPLASVVIFGPLLAATVWGAFAVARTRMVTVPKSGGEVRVQSRAVGGDLREPTVYRDVIGVAWRRDGRLVALRRDGDRVAEEVLVKLPHDKLGALGPVQRALFPERR